MTVVRTKLFIDDDIQTVLLPKEVEFPDEVTEVEIIISGDARLIVPKGQEP